MNELLYQLWFQVKNFEVTRNFFELVRFDFVVDETLKVFLLEVNMSPNLSPITLEFNRALYEQVVVNVLKLVGIERYKFNMKKLVIYKNNFKILYTHFLQKSYCTQTFVKIDP